MSNPLFEDKVIWNLAERDATALNAVVGRPLCKPNELEKIQRLYIEAFAKLTDAVEVDLAINGLKPADRWWVACVLDGHWRATKAFTDLDRARQPVPIQPAPSNYELFRADLVALCRKYEVKIEPSNYGFRAMARKGEEYVIKLSDIKSEVNS